MKMSMYIDMQQLHCIIIIFTGGVSLLLSDWLRRCVVEWKEVSSRLMWVRMKIDSECWMFISAYGPGSERSEEDIEDFWSELSKCV